MKLALGDIKALLMHLVGKQKTRELLEAAGLKGAVESDTINELPFGGYKTATWAQLRIHYPEKMDLSKLEGEQLKDDEYPLKFLHNFQRKWKEETGSAWNANNTTESLFKMIVKKSLPQQVQKKLEEVVGLMKMDWPLFSEHVVHHVEQCRKEKRELEEQNKQMASKLTQLQLGELTKHKKDKDKAKTQAPVVTAERVQPPQSADTCPITATAGTAIPAIHVHIDPRTEQGPMRRDCPGGYSMRGAYGQPPARPMHRAPWNNTPQYYDNWNDGMGRRRMGGRNIPFQPRMPGQAVKLQSEPQLAPVPQAKNNPPTRNQPLICWTCGQEGHLGRNCPNEQQRAPAEITHPWS